MFKVLVVILIVFSFSFVVFAGFQKQIVFDDEAPSLVRIFVGCDYSVLLKEPKDKEVKIMVQQMGNGFFAGDHKDGNEFIVTAAHLLWCNSTIGELEENGIFKEYDKSLSEDITIQNIIALKNKPVSRIFSYTTSDVQLTDIKQVFVSPVTNSLAEPDKALLKAILPEGALHKHFPLLEDKIFDDVILRNGIKKPVYVRGFLYFSTGWFLRFKDAEIEWVTENTFQINELLDRGISGSPVIYVYEGIPYAIGVASRSPLEVLGRSYDWSWSTTIKKSFLNIKKQKE